jgi:hypothetical protein
MRSTITQWHRAALTALLSLLVPFPTVAQDRAAPPPASDDPFARRAWTLDLGMHGAIETWNYNGSHEDLVSLNTGITYGLGKGVVLKGGSLLYRVWQRGTDGYLFGGTCGVRSRIYRRPQWSLFWEFEVGVSEADTFVPPRGTRFNYLAIGGVGTTIRIRRGVDILAGLRWIHLSNNSLAGRNRNPDIEAVGPTLGVLVGF